MHLFLHPHSGTIEADGEERGESRRGEKEKQTEVISGEKSKFVMKLKK